MHDALSVLQFETVKGVDSRIKREASYKRWSAPRRMAHVKARGAGQSYFHRKLIGLFDVSRISDTLSHTLFLHLGGGYSQGPSSADVGGGSCCSCGIGNAGPPGPVRCIIL